jgi:glycosyltransferase involved in cell wall biosynthesis
MDACPLKISVITPSLNQGGFLEDAIASVINQQYPRLEYIIIDGASTDGSVEIIKKYEAFLSCWVSEADTGQSVAINKGLRRASGDVWTWLCADDTYQPGALDKIARAFEQHGTAQVIYGNTNFIDDAGRVTRIKKPGPYCRIKLLQNNYLYQPAVFVRRQALLRYGDLDEALHYGMDYEYWLRFASADEFVYIDEDIANYRLHAGSKTVRHTAPMVREMTAIKKKYGAGFRADWDYANFLLWGLAYYRVKRKLFGWLARMKDCLQ